MNTIEEAIKFIETCDLPRSSTTKARYESTDAGESTVEEVLNDSKDQALVVGSGLVSFATGLSADLREVVTNCALLAQLVANKRVPDKEKVQEWYEVYFDNLSRLGWAIQAKSFTVHHEKGDDFETNEAIISIATTLLGSAATALALVTTTLKALKAMSNGPWLQLFRRESQTARAARFQITVAEPITSGAMVTLLAFALDAKKVLSQVLFFKFHSTDVTLKHSSGTMTLNADLLLSIKEKLSEKVRDHSTDWIESLGEL